MEKMLGQFKKEVTDKQNEDKDVKEMREKLEELKKQVAEKDKYIVELGKTSDKQHKTVDEVKGNLEKTFTAKIKRRLLPHSSTSEPAARERARGEGSEPDDRLSKQDGAGQDYRVAKAVLEVQCPQLYACNSWGYRRLRGK